MKESYIILGRLQCINILIFLYEKDNLWTCVNSVDTLGLM